MGAAATKHASARTQTVKPSVAIARKGTPTWAPPSAKKVVTSGDKNLSGGNSGGAKNLKACTGECDADSQCAYGLKCFQRSKGEPIPGCKGNGGGKDWDYCYKPK